MVALPGRPADGPTPDPGARGRVDLRAGLRSLSSATLAVGSAAAFLVLVTLLSFVPEGGVDERTADRAVESPSAEAGRRLADRSAAWPLRGALPPEQPPPPRERVAQGAPT